MSFVQTSTVVVLKGCGCIVCLFDFSSCVCKEVVRGGECSVVLLINVVVVGGNLSLSLPLFLSLYFSLCLFICLSVYFSHSLSVYLSLSVSFFLSLITSLLIQSPHILPSHSSIFYPNISTPYDSVLKVKGCGGFLQAALAST